ncbi:MAG: hypothetical protein J2O49_07770 [Sciscionella sp.]|nr:hypothetical protein [Sciscionella sp.]
MTTMNCAQFQAVAAELTLGVLFGSERAQAIAHADHCNACRALVAEFTDVGDGLLAMVPGAEPHVGFENRVVDRIGAQHGARRTRPRWLRPVMAAATFVVVFGVGISTGIGADRAINTPPPTTADGATRSSLTSAALLIGGHQVGRAFVYTGKEPKDAWLYMSIDAGRTSGTVSCQLQRRAGAPVTIGSFAMSAGYGYWGAPITIDPTTITGARVVGADGKVLASAQFSTR